MSTMSMQHFGRTHNFRCCSKSCLKNACLKSFRSINNSSKKPKIVILGSGWGSYSVLKNINRKLFDIKVITPRNYFLFTPLLCSTTVGTLEFRSVIEPIRNIGFDSPDCLVLAHAEKLDLEKKLVFCKSILDNSALFPVEYDKLVIGVGCLNNTFGISGVEKYANFLKDIPDAQKIRNKLLRNCELALTPGVSEDEKKRLLHTVIIGGGPTGVEFGAELYDFKIQDMRKLYKQDEKLFRVTLVEAEHILRGFDQKLQAYVEKKFKERPNFNLIKSSVTEIKEDSVILKNGDVIPCGLVVWSAGLGPQPFTKSLPFSKNERFQLLTDEFLRVLDDPSKSIYALGDCAEVESYQLPCTAQVAERQGRYLAKSLESSVTGHPVEKFIFKSSGMLAYIGGYQGIADLPDFKARGFSSWFLWRSAYLTRLGSWRLRMQVPVDWMKTLLFGRDTSRFSS